LSQFSFPGNVRQLENICHWLTVMAPAQLIEPKDLPPEVGVRLDGGEAGKPGSPMAAMPAGRAEAAAEGMGLAGQSAAGPTLATPAGPLTEDWEDGLQAQAMALLASGRHDVWDELTRRFESRLILTALAATKGRRIEAAQKLGIGRNTITRKIQELGLE
jgi:two-component system nitrogen regulation response regulator GlnG